MSKLYNCDIIAFYLKYVLYYYLDNCIAIFKANVLLKKFECKIISYIWVINLLDFLQNNSKDFQKIVVIIFRIEIDISLFIA